MDTFNKVCAQLEQTEKQQLHAILDATCDKVTKELTDVTDGEVSATMLLGMFVTSALMADGNLSTGEYEFMKSNYEKSLGRSVDYDTCSALVKSASLTIDQLVGKLSDILADFDDGLKADILLLCLMICSIDGKISDIEKQWIAKLFAE